MTQEVLNSTNNINQPHNVSIWFQQNFTGDYRELGDLLVDGVSIAPEFADFNSYRNGINALRKRFLTNRAASISATLNEPNIVNLQRVLFGGTVSEGESITGFDGKHLTVKSDGGGTYFDLSDAGESAADFGIITVTHIHATTDVLEVTNLISVDLSPDTDGHVYFDGTDTGLNEGEIAYMRYSVARTGMKSTEIYGADNTTIEGAARFQARNLQGGVVQIWDLASINMSANGDLTYPIDAVQTVPVLLTLQERSGSFGKIYTL